LIHHLLPLSFIIPNRKRRTRIIQNNHQIKKNKSHPSNNNKTENGTQSIEQLEKENQLLKMTLRSSNAEFFSMIQDLELEVVKQKAEIAVLKDMLQKQ